MGICRHCNGRKFVLSGWAVYLLTAWLPLLFGRLCTVCNGTGEQPDTRTAEHAVEEPAPEGERETVEDVMRYWVELGGEG